MHKLQGTLFGTYTTDRAGGAQLWTLCASILVPRKVSNAELQHAANELFRINDELRVRFVEDVPAKEVYQEIKPFSEQVFTVLNFESKEALDAWGNKYAAYPLKLDVRAEGGKGIPVKYWYDYFDVKLTLKDIVRGLKASFDAAMARRKVGLKSEPSCCEIVLVQLPNYSGAVVKVHHIVSDALSMSLMANQFLQILQGETPVAYSYEEHLVSDEAYRESKAFARDLAFFEKQNSQFPVPPGLKSWDGKRKTAVLDESLTASILEYAYAHNVTPYTLLLTAMGIYMRCKLNDEKAVIGSTCFNRIGAHEKNMVGLFFNIPSLVLELDRNANFADTIAAVNAANYTCMRHQRACFDAPNPAPYKYVASYQTAIIDADPTAVCTQYYCDIFTYCMITIEDRNKDGRFKLHLDYSLELFPNEQEMDDLLSFVIAAIREGVADDSMPINQIGA